MVVVWVPSLSTVSGVHWMVRAVGRSVAASKFAVTVPGPLTVRVVELDFGSAAVMVGGGCPRCEHVSCLRHSSYRH